MARAGRALEEFVRELERLLARSPVDIKSPDHLPDRRTGAMREVDVSLRSHVGSVLVLVIMECRDRSDAEDVSWIDELVGKREAVGANKAIAISASGFSKSARTAASATGIGLRTFEEVSEADLRSWLSLDEVIVHVRYANFTGIKFGIGEGHPTLDGYLPHLPASLVGRDVPILIKNDDGGRLTIDDLWKQVPKAGLMADLTPGERRRGTVHVAFTGPDRYMIETSSGLVDVEGLAITGEFGYDEHRVPIRRYYQYVAEDGVLTQNAEVTIAHDGKEMVFGIHGTPDGSRFSITRHDMSSTADVLDFDMWLDFQLIERENPRAE